MIYLKKKLSLFLVLTLLAFFTACSSEIEINKDSPQTTTVKPGSKFKIILPEDHSTGYSWQLNQDFDQKSVQLLNTVWHGNDKGVYFHFRAGQKGEAVLTFTNRKYTDTLNVKSFIVKIIDK